MAKNRKSGTPGVQLTALRNPLHNHPLLGKGAVHQKTNKAQRHHDKLRMRREWQYDRGNGKDRGTDRDHLSACA